MVLFSEYLKLVPYSILRFVRRLGLYQLPIVRPLLYREKSNSLPNGAAAKVGRGQSRVGSRLDILRFLPLGVLGAVGSPLGGSAGSTPLLAGSTSTVPAGSAGGTSSAGGGEAGSGSVPVTRGGLEARLDGGGALLLGLLLLDLLLSLGFGVAV